MGSVGSWRWLKIVLCLALVVFQAACGGGDIDEDKAVAETPSLKPILAIAPFSIAENSTQQVVFTLTRPNTVPTSFTWSISQIAAPTAGRFSSLSGTVTIPAGQTALPISLPLLDDGIYQQDQDFRLTIMGQPPSVTLPTPSILFKLLDNEPVPIVRFSTPSQTVAEASGSATVTFQLSPPSTFATTIGFTTSGTATSPSDYTVTPASSVTFAPNQISQTVTVSLMNDSLAEPDEVARFALGLVMLGYANPSATLNTHDLTIANDDYAATITQVTSSKTDGSYGSGTVPVTVQFSQAVTVSGTPQLTMKLSPTNRIANYVSGSGTTNLVFNYVIQASDTSADLDYVSTSSLALNGGTIRNTADALNAQLDLPVPGAVNSLSANKEIHIDTAIPVVTNVTSTTTDGPYKAGASISVLVAFSKAVTVTGVPKLLLETGTTDESISYTSGSGTNTLTFSYTVQAGDTSADLDYGSTASLSLNGGTIRDVASNNANLTLVAPGAVGSIGANKSLVIDTTAPLVAGVSSSVANGRYTAGASVPILVSFSEVVFVSGTPQITLETGTTDRVLSYTSGSGSTILRFNYTVQSGDSAPLLDYTTINSLVLNGGTIVDIATNAGVLTLAAPGASGSLSISKSIEIDTTAPAITNLTSTSADGNYTTGAVIPIRVQFSEPVVVTGTPRLTLETGATDQAVNYTSGSGTTTLTFNYTVQTGDSSSALEANLLSFNGGTIKDAAGNSASLTLIAAGQPGSLSANKNLLIDTTPAVVTSVSSAKANGSYSVGDVIDVTVLFSEVVTVTGTPTLSLNTGGFASYQTGSGSSTLTFSYTVSSGETSADLDYVGANSLSGTIVDQSLNGATLTLPNAGASGSLGFNKNLVIDTTDPTVTSVTSSSTNGGYRAGKTISIRVNFFEAVTVTGTPTLEIETGTVDQTVNYVSGSGSSTLIFSYTVQPGDQSADLDYKATSSLAGTLADAAGNAAVLTLPSPGSAGSLGANKDLVIDTDSPVVTFVSASTANGYYKLNDVIDVIVTFSKAVTVTGAPQITLETGGVDRAVSYSSGSGTSALHFAYTIQTGDTSLDLDYISATSLALNSGTVLDAVGNAAVLTLAAPGTTASLGANKNIVVDTTVPTTPSSVDDQTWTTSLSSATTTSWAGSTDVTSGVDRYEFALGTSIGGSEVTGWVSNGLLLTRTPSSLSLIEGTTYYSSVRAVDRSGNTSGIASGDGFKPDVTLPTIPASINDGITSAVTNQSTPLSWGLSTDSLSGIATYQVAIGTALGLDDVSTWSNVAGTTKTVSSLSLTEGATYYASVRAVDAAGNIGPSRNGDGWVIGWLQESYIKAANNGAGDNFGRTVAISGDTMVVGVPNEDSNQTTITTTASTNNSAVDSGAVYVYVRSGTSWALQAYIKAGNSSAGDSFGSSVAIDGDTIVVGAPLEDGSQSSISASFPVFSFATSSGAAYVYTRSGTTWTMQNYIKPTNNEAGDLFGTSVAVSNDTIVVGAPAEESNTTGTSTTASSNNSSVGAGAAYVFKRAASTWTQQSYLKAATNKTNVKFGSAVAVDVDSIIVGAPGDSSNVSGVVNGTGGSSSSGSTSSGAAYVFKRSASTWAQEAYLKEGTTVAGDQFGTSVSISGETAVVGAPFETSNTGSAYVFARSTATWSQEAYLKSPNADTNDKFGTSVSVRSNLILIGSPGESSSLTSVTQGSGTSGDNGASSAGAAHLYRKSGASWPQLAFLKAPNSGAGDAFGSSVAISGSTLAVGAPLEDSNSNVITNGQTASSDDSNLESGAVYLFNR